MGGSAGGDKAIMYCPNCSYQMTCMQRDINEKEEITLRIYECKRCEWGGVIETKESVLRSGITKPKLTAMRLKTAMRKVVKDMRSMKHENLTDLERQALRFAAG